MAKFNREKVLRKIELKKMWRSYSRYVYIVIPCVLCSLLCLYFAYSKFFVSKEQEVIRTTVAPFIQGDVVIGAYIDNEYSSTIPAKGTGYVVDKVVCDNDAVGKWDDDKWGLLTTNLTKRTKCNVYFKKAVSKVPDIIAQLDTTGKCPTVNADGTVSVTEAEKQYGYLCKAKDAYGDSYYYRGNVTNNYVKFGEWQVRKYFGYFSDNQYIYHMYDSLEECQNASSYNKRCAVGFDIGTPMYWRIVRINGDGTVRVIYDGTSAHANYGGSDKQIGASVFNSIGNDNAYVGYMYGKIGASTYAEAHANTNDSTIKAYIDNWYKTNILGTANEQYLADNIFCNDRSISSGKPYDSYNNLGYGTNFTAYRWYYGPWSSGGYNSNMRLTCPQKNDAFTVSDTTNGNGALVYPVGLLSTDEIVLAGLWNDANRVYYLNSGQYWWTSSSYIFDGGILAGVRYMDSVGTGDTSIGVDGNFEVRPVFNLKAEVLAQGSGTASDPYRISSD